MVCDFFSKGWCIKGSSCRFVHKRDHMTVSSQYVEGHLNAAEEKTKLVNGKGTNVLFCRVI